MNVITDNLWLDANLHPAKGRAELGISIPDLPSVEIQTRFTGRHGRDNLQQAFDFYKFVLKHMPRENGGRLRLIDFGGGWGRILRFFLREFPANRLVLFDCLTAAVECARNLKPPFAVEQNGVSPPLPLEKTCVDCCYAFSVFSHLSERASLSWLAHLGDILVPGGKLIITTRGTVQIRHMRHLKPGAGLQASKLPPPDEIQRIYDSGAFQFYPTGGGGELTDDFYGQTWITQQWMRNNHRSLGFSQCDFFTEFATVDQCVFVLTKPKATDSTS